MAAGQTANKGFKHVGRLELPGAGQVVVEGHYAYIGHMRPPHGTSIVDRSSVAERYHSFTQTVSV
jgi:hypothetical protein